MLHAVYHAVEGDDVVGIFAKWCVSEVEVSVVAVKYCVENVFGQILNRRFHRELKFFGKSVKCPEQNGFLAFANGGYCTFVYRKVAVGNKFFEVNIDDGSKSVALWASSLRRVERKRVRSRFLVRNSACGTHQETTIERRLVGTFFQNHRDSLAKLHGKFDGLAQTLAVVVAFYCELIDNNFNEMVLVAVELEIVFHFGDFAINAGSHVAPATNILEKFLVVTFSSIYKRCENINRLSAKLFGYDVNYLVVAVFHHFLASDIRICR